MTSVNKQSNAKDNKADEVCTNKCPKSALTSAQDDLVLLRHDTLWLFAQVRRVHTNLLTYHGEGTAQWMDTLVRAGAGRNKL